MMRRFDSQTGPRDEDHTTHHRRSSAKQMTSADPKGGNKHRTDGSERQFD